MQIWSIDEYLFQRSQTLKSSITESALTLHESLLGIMNGRRDTEANDPRRCSPFGGWCVSCADDISLFVIRLRWDCGMVHVWNIKEFKQAIRFPTFTETLQVDMLMKVSAPWRTSSFDYFVTVIETRIINKLTDHVLRRLGPARLASCNVTVSSQTQYDQSPRWTRQLSPKIGNNFPCFSSLTTTYAFSNTVEPSRISLVYPRSCL